MVETISLEWLSANVRQLQADIRTLRSDIALLNKRIDIIVDRVAMFEAKVESRLVQIDTNMGILLARSNQLDTKVDMILTKLG